MKLTPSTVADIFKDCLPAKSSALENQTVKVKGIVITVLFIKEKLSAHQEEICSLLNELPDGFQKSKGGGMSFLKMCEDKNGNLWTGEHRVMEMLLLLGLGIEKISFAMTREMWSVLPGGMPYITVED